MIQLKTGLPQPKNADYWWRSHLFLIFIWAMCILLSLWIFNTKLVCRLRIKHSSFGMYNKTPPTPYYVRTCMGHFVQRVWVTECNVLVSVWLILTFSLWLFTWKLFFIFCNNLFLKHATIYVYHVCTLVMRFLFTNHDKVTIDNSLFSVIITHNTS